MVIDTGLEQGDHQRDGRGLPHSVTGTEETIQQAMIRFTVPKGRFRLDPALGSLFHRLGQAPEGLRDETAFEYAREALLGLPDVTVLSANCRNEGERVLLDVRLACAGGEQAVLRLGISL